MYKILKTIKLKGSCQSYKDIHENQEKRKKANYQQTIGNSVTFAV
jgi:hypothetical protein